ncbi:unnamed protein product [Merluccius merluccius]
MFESHPDWAPSLNLGPNETTEMETETETEPVARHSNQHSQKDNAEVGPLAVDKPEPAENHTALVGNHSEPASIVVELTEEAVGETGGEPAFKELTECDFCGYRRAEINRLLNENRELKCALAKQRMDEESLKEDDAKVKYYTGLPYFGLLMGLLSTVMPYLPRGEDASGHKRAMSDGR